MTLHRRLEIHELANQFPTASTAEYEALKKDIAQNGLQTPIVLFEGKILDGRHRYQACCELDIPVKTEKYLRSYEEASRYSAAANLLRRHLSKSQKAMYLVKTGIVPPPGPEGRRRKYGQGDEGGIRELAIRYGVNHMTVYKAAYVYQHDKELAERVVGGKMSVGRAESKIRDRIEKNRRSVTARNDVNKICRRIEQLQSSIAALAGSALDNGPFLDAAKLLEKAKGLVTTHASAAAEESPIPKSAKTGRRPRKRAIL